MKGLGSLVIATVVATTLLACAQSGPNGVGDSASVEGSVAHSIYTKIMERRTDYDDLATNKKVLAACINWQATGKNHVDLRYSYVYYESEFTERTISTSRLMGGAMNGCKTTKKERNQDCDCVAVDRNGSPVLRVPKSVSESTSAAGSDQQTAAVVPPTTQETSLSDRRDPDICTGALSHKRESKYGTPSWEDYSGYFSAFVNEAKHRGFTAQSCASLLGWKSGESKQQQVAPLPSPDEQPNDYAEAFVMWRASAQQGDREAQYQIGRLYQDGQGVPQNFVHAYAWYNLSAGKGHYSARQAKKALARQMTPGQIAEAQKLTIKLIPTGAQ